MFTETRKGTHYHKYFVDSETQDMVCLCGAVREPNKEDRPKKFHNTSSEYNGFIYQSMLEARYAADLDWRVKGHDIKSWDRQVKIAFAVCPKCSKLTTSSCADHPDEKQFHLVNYYMDFVIHHNDGTDEYVECKGAPTDLWKLKWTMLEAVHGNSDLIKLTVVKEPRAPQWSYRKGKRK